LGIPNEGEREMEITKEKNYLIMTSEGEVKYRYDFSNDIMTGASNKELVRKPTYFKKWLNEKLILTNPNLAIFLQLAIKGNYFQNENYLIGLKGAEFLDSLGIVQGDDFWTFTSVGLNTKEYQNYRKYDGLLEWREYMRGVDAIKFYSRRQDLTFCKDMNPLLAYVLFYCIGTSSEPIFIQYCYNKFNNLKIDIRDLNGLLKFLWQSYLVCKKMGTSMDKTGNIIRQFCEISSSLALQRSGEAKTEKWKELYESEKDKILFENDLFKIVLPEKPCDLIKEGVTMHHCVGSYVDKVLQGDCLIVFIRKKENPDLSYITCELKKTDKGFDIYQYYLAYDRYIADEQDLKFKQEYECFLKRV
jgi:hypothetical protein